MSTREENRCQKSGKGESGESREVSCYCPKRVKLRACAMPSSPSGGQGLSETLGKGYGRGYCLLGIGQWSGGEVGKGEGRGLLKVSWPIGLGVRGMRNWHSLPCWWVWSDLQIGSRGPA